MPRVVHFELPVEDPQRAARFYSEVFGWNFNQWDGPEEYWLTCTGHQSQPGIDGGMMRRCSETPAKTPINVLDVPSVDEYVGKVEAAGGKIVMPKMAVPGVGYVAYFQDTEGIVSGMMQFDKSATA